MSEPEQRAAVVREALSWQRTPYKPHARIKGVAADCGTFLLDVFSRCGVISADVAIPELPAQWFLHTRHEYYIEYLSRYFAEYQSSEKNYPQPGDVICALHGRVYSHGAIVVEWPEVIHCFPPCVMKSNTIFNPVYVGHKLRFFNPWGKTGV